MEGVDPAGTDARAAHLGAVLEELLLPGHRGCGRGDSEMAETLPVPQPCLVLLLFPSHLDAFVPTGYFSFFYTVSLGLGEAAEMHQGRQPGDLPRLGTGSGLWTLPWGRGAAPWMQCRAYFWGEVTHA